MIKLFSIFKDKPIVVGFVGLAVVGVISTLIFIMGRPHQEEVNQLPTVTTAGWKNFTHTDMSYSFKYPADWLVDEGDYAKGPFALIKSPDFKSSTPLPRDRLDMTLPIVTSGAAIAVYRSSDKGEVGVFNGYDRPVMSYGGETHRINQVYEAGYGGRFVVDSEIRLQSGTPRVMLIHPEGHRDEYYREYWGVLQTFTLR